MKKIPQTIEDLRREGTQSGFAHVEEATGGMGSQRHLVFQRSRKWRARSYGTTPRWSGPVRDLPEEAAQDYIDYINGLPIAAQQVIVRQADLRPKRRFTVTSKVTRKDGFPAPMKKAIHARAAGMCENCGEKFPYREAHHIDPDGDHAMDNGSSLCPNCHAITSRGTPEEAEAINAKLRALRAVDNPPAAVQRAA